MTCDHYPVRLKGQIVCRNCRAVAVFDLRGTRWRPPLTHAQRGGMPDRPKAEWRRHDGGPCPTDRRRRIQWRVIGTIKTQVVRANNHDWSMTFEWRPVG